jgi:CubicO group peptidase (beta-lactamase class C family)
MSTGGLSRARLARVHDVMAGYVERGEVPGLVTAISRRGELRVDAIGMQAIGGDTPISRDTIFRVASMTKPITAAAAMILVEECKLRLDDAIDAFLPELANRRVLRRLDDPLDGTVPANRPITLRDLLTFRCGLGAVMLPPGTIPIQKAMEEAGLAPSPNPVVHSPDSYMKRLGALPLMHQPGERWMYHTGSEILGVLIARASGQSFADFLRVRIFEPLGMKDTDFLRAAWHERYGFPRASRQAPSASHQLPT